MMDKSLIHSPPKDYSYLRVEHLHGNRGILQELEALRKLRMAVGKMVRHIDKGDEHPKDLQQVKLFLSEAEKVESPLVRGDHFHV